VRRRLDVELVRRGLAESRSRAAAAIAAGRVLVGGTVARSAAHQVAPSESVALSGPARRFVSRGGEKLEGALDRFGVVAAGRRVLDAGASTGGFTDCLLERGAERVYAVDVGRGQLAWRLRSDPRVTTLERVNVRHLDPAALGGAVPLAVADLSFISLLTVAPALDACTTRDAALVLLVKPQFEAGRARVGKGGVVRDASVHADVLAEVASGLERAGLPVVDAVASPIAGADGNREFFVHCVKGATPIDAAQLVDRADVEVPVR
jgi:23S rRNA (cytidine1920-2'-O)/16S rRNA (cytidine1409-2'-O)-methyltransferase